MKMIETCINNDNCQRRNRYCPELMRIKSVSLLSHIRWATILQIQLIVYIIPNFTSSILMQNKAQHFTTESILQKNKSMNYFIENNYISTIGFSLIFLLPLFFTSYCTYTLRNIYRYIIGHWISHARKIPTPENTCFRIYLILNILKRSLHVSYYNLWTVC